MGKRFGPFGRFFATLGLTLGMALALPGCSSSSVQTPQAMSQSVADQTDDFVTALQNGDVKKMKEIRDDVKDKQKDLDKEENRRIDNGEDITDLMQPRVILKNQEACLTAVINEYQTNNNTIPKSSDFWGNIADGVGGAASAAYDFLDGDPIYDTTAIVTEFAKQNNDYVDLALSDQNLFLVWYGKDFKEVYAIRGDNALGSYVLEQLYNLGYNIGAGFQAGHDKFVDGLRDAAEANSENQDGTHDYVSREQYERKYRAQMEKEVQQDVAQEHIDATQEAYDKWKNGEGEYDFIRQPDGTLIPVEKGKSEQSQEESTDDDEVLGLG